MPLLLLVSFLWAFSFGLIKGRLAGVDPTAVAALRLALALLVFLPFFRPGRIARGAAGRLAAIGAVQFGLMYVLYLRAYHYLAAYEVALFTIFTPVFVALIDAGLERRWQSRHALAAVLAVTGAAAVLWRTAPGAGVAAGFLLMQGSNVCFAAGQLAWRRERARLDPAVSDAAVFALPYAGALAATLAVSCFTTDWTALALTFPQTATLVYLGVLASGAGFFWWNRGATQVNAGTLAVMNNLKIPLSVACSLLFFGEHADLPRLLLSGGCMFAALALAEGWFEGKASRA